MAPENGTSKTAHDVLAGTSKKGRFARLLPFLGPAFVASRVHGSGHFATNIGAFGYLSSG
jgi:hypothetical protein